MDKETHLTLIPGGYDTRLHGSFQFLSAKATKTRLMGVVGVAVHWKTGSGSNVHELFHLDFESYGIDGYEIFEEPEEEVLHMQTLNMMGGLGGPFVALSLKFVKALLQAAVAVSSECLEVFPQVKKAYPQIGKNTEEAKKTYNMAIKLLSDPIQTPYGVIHYFLMRTIAMDWEGRKGLLVSEKENDSFCDLVSQPSTLLRNGSFLLENGHYQVTSLIETFWGYEIILSEIEVFEKENRILVKKAKFITRMSVSIAETGFMLRRMAYYAVFKVYDLDGEAAFYRAHPETVKIENEGGNLYLRFHPHNQHVDKQIYYISDDLLAVYYFTTDDQLVVASFKENHLNTVKSEFQFWINEKKLSCQRQFQEDMGLVYDFVNSGYDNIFDFLDKED